MHAARAHAYTLRQSFHGGNTPLSASPLLCVGCLVGSCGCPRARVRVRPSGKGLSMKGGFFFGESFDSAMFVPYGVGVQVALLVAARQLASVEAVCDSCSCCSCCPR